MIGSTALHVLCNKAFYAAADVAILDELLAHKASPALRNSGGMRPCDHLGKAMAQPTLDPTASAMIKKLAAAEAQQERWQARRSCLLLRARPGCGHIICLL